MFHDHVEKSFTTNGTGEGGDISLVVYDGFVDERGIPKSHGMSLAPYFAKSMWKGKYPIWQDYDAWHSLGLPDLTTKVEPLKVAVQTPAKSSVDTATAPAATADDSSAFAKLINGLILGLLAYVGFIKRRQILDFGLRLIKK
jgi:hypothetical protein